jgi:hypothetical protein
MNNENYTDRVKECIFCYEQSTSEKYDEDMHKANRYESCIYELFKLMTDDELNCYRAKLVELGYVDPSEYSRSENGLVQSIK